MVLIFWHADTGYLCAWCLQARREGTGEGLVLGAWIVGVLGERLLYGHKKSPTGISP